MPERSGDEKPEGANQALTTVQKKSARAAARAFAPLNALDWGGDLQGSAATRTSVVSDSRSGNLDFLAIARGAFPNLCRM